MAGKKGSGAGGAGKGQGRKPNNPNGVPAISKVRATEIIRTGNAPLDVMLKNMHFWDEHADDMKSKIEATMLDLQSAAGDGDAKAIEELLEKSKGLLKGFLTARQNAQSCAVDAAPYVHARFQSITLKQEHKKILEVRAKLPAVSGEAKEDRSYREGYSGDIIPMTKKVG